MEQSFHILYVYARHQVVGHPFVFPAWYRLGGHTKDAPWWSRQRWTNGAVGKNFARKLLHLRKMELEILCSCS